LYDFIEMDGEINLDDWAYDNWSEDIYDFVDDWDAEWQCASHPASDFAGVASPGGGDGITQTIVNDSDMTVQVDWIDFSGNRVNYVTLGPWETYDQGTYVGHIWTFVVDGVDVQYYIADRCTARFVFHADEHWGDVPTNAMFNGESCAVYISDDMMERYFFIDGVVTVHSYMM